MTGNGFKSLISIDVEYYIYNNKNDPAHVKEFKLQKYYESPAKEFTFPKVYVIVT